MLNLIWLIPLLPLVGVAINGLVGRRMSRPVVCTIACAVIFNMKFPEPGEEPFDLLDDEVNRN